MFRNAFCVVNGYVVSSFVVANGQSSTDTASMQSKATHIPSSASYSPSPQVAEQQSPPSKPHAMSLFTASQTPSLMVLVSQLVRPFLNGSEAWVATYALLQPAHTDSPPNDL